MESWAGEIVINSIDRDGMMNGYDIELAEKSKKCSIPIRYSEAEEAMRI